MSQPSRTGVERARIQEKMTASAPKHRHMGTPSDDSVRQIIPITMLRRREDEMRTSLRDPHEGLAEYGDIVVHVEGGARRDGGGNGDGDGGGGKCEGGRDGGGDGGGEGGSGSGGDGGGDGGGDWWRRR